MEIEKEIEKELEILMLLIKEGKDKEVRKQRKIVDKLLNKYLKNLWNILLQGTEIVRLYCINFLII